MSQKSALKFPIYRRFLTGSLLSSIGDHVGMVALNWYVLETTSSALYLGLINFFRLLPALFIGMLGGWLADRFPRRELLIALYLPIIGLSLTLAFYVSIGPFHFWLLSILVILRGLFDEMEPPIRNALLPEMVSKQGLASGVALYTTMLNIARIIGPAIAGIVMARYGVSSLFFFQAFSQLAVFMTLFAIPKKRRDEQIGSKKEAQGSGYYVVFIYLKTHPHLLYLFLFSVIFMIFGFPYSSLVPVYVQEVLGMGPEAFGYLLTATAIGAVLGAWGLTRLNPLQQARFIPLFATGFAVFFLLLGAFQNLWLVVLSLFMIGMFSQAFRTAIRIVFQLAAPENMRGRLMSIVLADRGFIPLGILLASSLSEAFGIAFVFIFMSACCLLSVFPYLMLSQKQTIAWNERSDSSCN